MSILDSIFNGSPEKRVLDRCKKIVDHAVAANRMLLVIINGSKSLDQIRDVERDSDKEVFDISNSITSGAIAPNLIDDMIRLADIEDGVVDNIFNLSRMIARYRSGSSKADKYTKENLLRMHKLINAALVLLYELHKAETVDQARKVRLRIEAIEQEGDEIKDAMLDYAYNAKGIDFKSFYYIQEVAHRADDVLDGCEDTSDMILSIMRSIVT